MVETPAVLFLSHIQPITSADRIVFDLLLRRRLLRMVGGPFTTATAAFAARRALLPAAALGTAVTGAGWFGVFEFVFGTSKLVMPVPEKQDESARITGALSVPCVTGAFFGVGWMSSPAGPPVPTKALDWSGWVAYLRGLPLRHAVLVGAGSATASAVCCRVIQYRGGA